MSRPLILPALVAGAFLCLPPAVLAQSAPAVPSAANALPVAGAVPATPPVAAKPVIAVPKRATVRRKIVRSKPNPILRGVSAATRAATLEPSAAGFIQAVQVYPFVEGTVYQLYAAPERVTDIALQSGEVLGAVAAGDTVRWVIGDTSSGSGEAKRTHVLVKPFAAGQSTNIVITTDRRVYHLSLVSVARSAMTGLSWIYPQDALLAVRKANADRAAAMPVASGLAVEQLSFGYRISGDTPAWRPLRAFDDGRQTFIEFPPSLAVGEAPPLFLVDASGEAALVNYRVSGRYYVVDRLFDRAELRLGTKKQQIVRIERDGVRRGRGA